MEGIKELMQSTKKFSCLYVEDNPSLLVETQRFLKNFFPNLTPANDGQMALDLYKKTQFDLIISDLMMPNMGGKDLTREIKKINPDQQIIILSAHNEQTLLDELYAIGVDFILFKPLNLNDFIAKITAFVNQHQDNK